MRCWLLARGGSLSHMMGRCATGLQGRVGTNQLMQAEGRLGEGCSQPHACPTVPSHPAPRHPQGLGKTGRKFPRGKFSLSRGWRLSPEVPQRRIRCPGVGLYGFLGSLRLKNLHPSLAAAFIQYMTPQKREEGGLGERFI